MSRMEQIIGRGLRTCSHSGLDFEQQNCTVYLHTVRYRDSTQETYDEYMYRVYVEEKATKIAQVKRIISESAVDCQSQIATNMLPEAWRDMEVPQLRAQDQELVTLPLSGMSAPTFEDGTPALVCKRLDKPADVGYIRPLGAYFDIRDEVFDTLIRMFEKKPIWSIEDLQNAKGLQYSPEVVTFLLQDAVDTHLKIRDASGRVGVLENRGKMYTFTPDGIENGTMIERAIPIPTFQRTTVPVEEEVEEEKPVSQTLAQIKGSYKFPFDVSEFSEEVQMWHIIDQQITTEQKIALLQTLDRAAELPIWAKGIVVGDLLAISPTQIYNTENVAIEPVGLEKDAIKAWVATHITKLVEEIKEHDKILCTVEDRVLKFAAFEVVDGHVSRIKRTKTITPKACAFFVQPPLQALVKDCIGHDFPPEVTIKEKRCIYLSLAVRTAVLADSERVFWVNPEVWSFLSKESVTIRAKIA